MEKGDVQAAEERAEFVRLPGLFRRWELEQVLEAGTDFRIEDAGEAADGTPLLAVYYRLDDERGDET